MSTPISNLIQVIPGYLQNRGQANQGIPGICQEFIQRYDFRGLAHTELDEWDTNWETQAEWMYRNTLGGPTPKILVVAYSWGCGFGFVQLAKYLRDRGLEITHAVLADPVYHWGARWNHGFRLPGTNTYVGLAQLKAYYPYFKWTQALVDWHLLPPRPKIVVPDNVRRIDFFLQRNSSLHGHELHCLSKSTVTNRVVVPYFIHTNMDDCQLFVEASRKAAKELFEPFVPTIPQRTESVPNAVQKQTRPPRKPRGKL